MDLPSSPLFPATPSGGGMLDMGFLSESDLALDMADIDALLQQDVDSLLAGVVAEAQALGPVDAPAPGLLAPADDAAQGPAAPAAAPAARTVSALSSSSSTHSSSSHSSGSGSGSGAGGSRPFAKRSSAHLTEQLTEEEIELLAKEGFVMPKHRKLTAAEEKEVRQLRRKIKNKQSAQTSRLRKRAHVEDMKSRVENYSHELEELRRENEQLQQRNVSLAHEVDSMKQRLAALLPRGATIGTALMLLGACFTLVAPPAALTAAGPGGGASVPSGPGAADSCPSPQLDPLAFRGRTLLETADYSELKAWQNACSTTAGHSELDEDDDDDDRENENENQEEGNTGYQNNSVAAAAAPPSPSPSASAAVGWAGLPQDKFGAADGLVDLPKLSREQWLQYQLLAEALVPAAGHGGDASKGLLESLAENQISPTVSSAASPAAVPQQQRSSSDAALDSEEQEQQEEQQEEQEPTPLYSAVTMSAAARANRTDGGLAHDEEEAEAGQREAAVGRLALDEASDLAVPLPAHMIATHSAVRTPRPAAPTLAA